VKTLCAGAVVALAAGLLAGAAMKPDLSAPDLAAADRLAGPQVLADPGPPRAPAPAPADDGVTYTSYLADRGRTPDYVLGTDWKKLTAPPPAPSRDAADIVRLEQILRSPPPDDDTPAVQAPPPTREPDGAAPADLTAAP
jgi:hypothetical protein